MKCVIRTCPNTFRTEGVKFYRFPVHAIEKPESIYHKLSHLRRKAWISACQNVADLSVQNIRFKRICNKHFVSGRKADIMDIKNVDWTPTVKMTSNDTRIEDADEENMECDIQNIDSEVLFENENDVVFKKYLKQCSVSNCLTNSQSNKNIKFFKFPKKSSYMPSSYKHIEWKRRQAWIQTIPIKNINRRNVDKLEICEKHFLFGRPADVLNYCHVDWVPTQFGTNSISCQDADVYQYASFKENMGEWIFEDFTENSDAKYANNQQIIEQIINKTSTNKPNINDQNVSTTSDKKKINIVITADNEKSIAPLVDHEYSKKPPITYKIKISEESGNHSKKIQPSTDKEMTIDETTTINDVQKIDPLSLLNCESCQLSFASYFELFSHKLTKTQCIEESLFCEMCEEVLSPQIIRQHFEKHAANQTFFCSICDINLTITSIQFMDHMKTHLSTKYYICSDCGQYFLNKIDLTMHFSVHRFDANSIAKDFFNDSQIDLTSECEEVSSGNKQTETDSKSKFTVKYRKSGRPVFSCNFCAKKFLSKKTLEIHSRNHTIERLYYCTICQTSLIGNEMQETAHKKIHQKVIDIEIDVDENEVS